MMVDAGWERQRCCMTGEIGRNLAEKAHELEGLL